MNDNRVQQSVSRAVDQAYEDWAAEHPSLASVIDRMSVRQRTVESLRESPEYRKAVADYHRSRDETALLNRLLDLATPVLNRLLGM